MSDSTTWLFGPDELPDVWFACDFPERPYELGATLLCGKPCRACLVVAKVELNKLNPLTEDPRNLASWHEIVGILAGEQAA